MITVEYTGSYPNACSGEIIIFRNNVKIYETKEYSFGSNGTIWFDDDWNEHVEQGELYWNKKNEKERFYNWVNQQPEKDEIITQVENKLSEINVCCGGCV